MNEAISIRVPFERGSQLRDLAVAHGVTVTEAIGLLLDHGARTGLGKLAMPGIDITAEGGAVIIKLDGFAIQPLSAVNVRSIAGSLRKAATSGAASLDADCSDMIEITRAGAAVVVQVRGENSAVLRKTISRGVARAVADRLGEAADEIEPIGELLGDLESDT
jgi:hypothetical protein